MATKRAPGPTRAVRVGRTPSGGQAPKARGITGRTASTSRIGMTNTGIQSGSTAYGRSAPSQLDFGGGVLGSSIPPSLDFKQPTGGVSTPSAGSAAQTRPQAPTGPAYTGLTMPSVIPTSTATPIVRSASAPAPVRATQPTRTTSAKRPVAKTTVKTTAKATTTKRASRVPGRLAL